MTSSRVRHGQVQAHGALLALVERDLAIAIASANTDEILGVPADQLVTAPISAALAADPPIETALRELPADLRDVTPLDARTHDGRAVEVVLHRISGLLVLEIEPAATPAVRTGRIDHALDRLRGDIARATVDELQALVGFDRVAVYRDDGELLSAVGEAPAFVPLQPGEVRFVADRAAPLVPLLPAEPLVDGATDITGISLHAIDMPGTGALLAISMGDGGVVVCKHGEARHVPYSTRAAAKLIAGMAGRLLGMHGGKRVGQLAGARVLIVDDEHEQCEILAMMLEAEGATIELAASATAAVDAFHRFHPDLVVSDIGLPDKDGFELVRELRALGSEEGGWIPAVAISGKVGAELGPMAMLSGFQLHMPKPIEPPDFVAQLARLVGRTVRRT